MKEIIQNKLELRVYGMRRTGQHAIIQWLLEYTPGKRLFLNNVPHETKETATSYFGMSEGQIEQNKKANFPAIDLYLFNIEDYPVQLGAELITKYAHLCQRGKSQKVQSIVIVRDPLNLFASRIKASDTTKQKQTLFDDQAYLYYLEHLQYCFGHPPAELIVINYNRWVLKEDYRYHIGKQLGLQGDFQQAYQQVPDYGLASSFDSREYHGNAHQMKLFERWKAFKGDSRLISLFKRPHLAQLSKEVFQAIHPKYSNWIQELMASEKT